MEQRRGRELSRLNRLRRSRVKGAVSGRRARRERLRDRSEGRERASQQRCGRRLKGGAALVAAIAAAGVIAFAALSVRSGGGDSGSDAPLSKAELRSLPKRVAVNEAQANPVIDGSIEARLEELRGIPVVVSQWVPGAPTAARSFPSFSS
ncbi:MAG: hypothetical protein U0R71_00865 [Solirubrobacterales bacterium]